MTVYLDNDVCSTVSRRDRETADLAALDALLGLGRSQIISIATSRHSVREMERAPAAYQSELKSGLHEMTFAQDDHRVLGSHTQVDPYWGCICSPLVTDIVDEPLMSKLIAAGLDIDDAKHVMYASHNRCERFLTWDKPVLHRRAALQTLCQSMRIQTPNEFVEELARAEATTNH